MESKKHKFRANQFDKHWSQLININIAEKAN